MSKSTEIAEAYQKYLMPTYKPSVVVQKAKGSRVYDAEGKQYYDFTSGIGCHNVGHCTEGVVKAIQEQVAKLGHCSNLFINEPQVKLAKKLVEISGLGGKVFFCNSGAEANEAAIKLARKWGAANGGRYEVITMRSSFHGRTLATLTATGQDWCQAGFEPLPVGFAYADFNDLESVKSVLTDKTVAIMLEAVQGEGGVTPATPEFMAGVRALCDEKDLIMICDEVQCGMGRTGKWWGWQNSDVKPDLFTCAKSIADGVPMGALVSNAKFADVFQPGNHASTFGGNPLACAAALATIKIIEDEKLLDAAKAKGEVLMAALQAFAEKYDQVLEVRGLGLMLGMVMDGEEKNKEVVDAFREMGILALTAGDNVVRFLPTLSMTGAHLEEAVEMMGDALDGLYGDK
ncbi:MAG: aspartate aminotransferase family protein [Kiritimatiellae bacterium]|nr:aspartate aminotransferase family protein [Kiritimatiellia bacterium]